MLWSKSCEKNMKKKLEQYFLSKEKKQHHAC